ncbi:MAG: hypothetical protein ACE5DN_02300 [Flavobacteriales bacterium]
MIRFKSRGFILAIASTWLLLILPDKTLAQWAPVTRSPFGMGRRYVPFRKMPDIFQMARAGFGIPYGCFGVSGEVGVTYFSLTGGVGYFVLSRGGTAPGWSIGTRVYFMKDKHRRRRPRKVRIRAGLYYSVHGVYVENDSRHVATGFSWSVGMQQRVKQNIFYDMDLNIIMRQTNSFRPQNRNLELPAFPSIGVGMAF